MAPPARKVNVPQFPPPTGQGRILRVNCKALRFLSPAPRDPACFERISLSMFAFFGFLKTFLTWILYKLGLGKNAYDYDSLTAPAPASDPDALPEAWWVSQSQTPNHLSGGLSLGDDLSLELDGKNGRIDAPTLLLEDNGQAVLIVEYDFRDIPSWVEWDRTWQKLSIAQMGGALAELPLGPEVIRASTIDRVRRLLLVTGTGESRISHFVSIIIRD